MDFKTATDRLMELGVTAREIAETLGLKPNTVRAMRLNPSSNHRRTPPPGWERSVARYVRGRSEELDAIAASLHGTAEAPTSDRETSEWRRKLEVARDLEDWLEDRLRGPRSDSDSLHVAVRAIRRPWGPLIWAWRDFERGRSRVFGVDHDVVQYATGGEIVRAAETQAWRSRIEEEALLVEFDGAGELAVSEWEDPDVPEAWFPDPRGGFCVAFERLGEDGSPFLAIHCRRWRGMGDANPGDPRDYTEEELVGMLSRRLAERAAE